MKEATVLTRRDFVKQTAIASVAAPVVAHAQGGSPQPAQGAAPAKTPANPVPVRVGTTDCKTPTLRDTKTQEAFRRAALDNGIQICSLAIGNPGKSRLPMHTNPAFAILLVE